ncbi:MAG: hypothetical protein C3L24_12805 [Candidatus Sedimenticola endophacoides]|uniref:Transposase DDE domain-containing protein n=1 Tax=Candidatus Sedimenticola endophacoides TaxID=2548426 RepID=A0A6N4DK49_9GAMM|nr:MAG: hypothetical protein C3L24_12805 [Candidatus Sedimenticola endophacoides]
MSKSTQEPLRFLPVDGLSVRGDFDGGALSSDFGPMILRGLDVHDQIICGRFRPSCPQSLMDKEEPPRTT